MGTLVVVWMSRRGKCRAFVGLMIDQAASSAMTHVATTAGAKHYIKTFCMARCQCSMWLVPLSLSSDNKVLKVGAPAAQMVSKQIPRLRRCRRPY